MRIIVRGFGDGKLVIEERLEFIEPEELAPIAERQLETICAYEMHMLEIEFLDEPDPFKRFARWGSDTRGMIQPLALPILPTHCADCGALLKGGATVHAPGCAFQAIIDEHFGRRPS